MKDPKPQMPKAKVGRPAQARGAARTASPSPKAASPKPVSNRAARAAERREAIIAAGLEEFVARGFAATRLDDVAKRAGVAKGTIYLHFQDKEALFQELIRSAVAPVIDRLAAPAVADRSAREMFESFAEMVAHDVVATRRGDILRLFITEGSRFPSLAEFYYREVVARGMAGMRALIQYGIARGEIREPALARFPQLMVAPAIAAVIWHGLFERLSPLDTAAMLRVHIDLIFGERRTA
ncbi:MAG TPA: TetR/AcrR family transcriptional regulator [Bradyrhizobium sp.]|jgi:AcrR family transcriptional regulator|nr:TetR/AcrR family transcriptional regulator [Bradyrhizobium sp.]